MCRTARVGSSTVGCSARDHSCEEYIEPKCSVEFRPSASFDGSYGFDWLRKGDTDFEGDFDYREILGEYHVSSVSHDTPFTRASDAEYDHLIYSNYLPFSVKWPVDSLGCDYKTIYSAWLSLFPRDQCSRLNNRKCQATVKLHIEVRDCEPEALRFEFNRHYFSLDHRRIGSKSVGSHQMDLTITCNNPYNEDEDILVIADKEDADGVMRHEMVGRLRLIANANIPLIDIVFVTVTTALNPIANPEPRAGYQTEDEINCIKKFFNQSLVGVNIADAQLDLTEDHDFLANYKIILMHGTNHLHLDRGQHPVVVKILLTIISNGVETISAYPHDYLTEKFNRETANQYESRYKVFFFNEAGVETTIDEHPPTFDINYLMIEGEAKGIPSKSLLIFHPRNNTTLSHELLHCTGLRHPFDSEGPFTFRIGTTGNIMDYPSYDADYSYSETSGLIVGSAQPYDVPFRTTTWKWQWDIVRAHLEPSPS